MKLLLTVWAASVVSAASMSATMMERFFPDQTEKQVATDFQDYLPGFLRESLKQPVKPRITREKRRETRLYELDRFEDDETVWNVMVPEAPLVDTTKILYRPSGVVAKWKLSEIEPKEVAAWFKPKLMEPKRAMQFAVWLYSQDCEWLANSAAGFVASRMPDAREDIENWLCEKNEWTRPEEGLIEVSTVEYPSGHERLFLVTKQANEERIKELERPAKDGLKDLSKLRGGTRGRPGKRATPYPSMRLDRLLEDLLIYEEAFKPTLFLLKEKNIEELKELITTVKEDIEYVEKKQEEIQTLVDDRKNKEAAQAWTELLKVDPKNEGLLISCALAWHRSARIMIYRNSFKCDSFEDAEEAAKYWDKLLDIFPDHLTLLNNAGTAWAAADQDKPEKARKYFKRVIRLTNKKGLTEAEEAARASAERYDKVLKPKG